jgi:hypothetical protein
MNITFSADEKLIEKARRVAQANGQTLNDLIRQFMQRIAGDLSSQQVADEFVRLATEHAGCSEGGFVFDRKAAHARGRHS